MILHQDFRDDLVEHIKNTPDEVFARYNTDSDAILNAVCTMDNLWARYQKSIEDYGCDPGFAYADAMMEVLNIDIQNDSNQELPETVKLMAYGRYGTEPKVLIMTFRIPDKNFDLASAIRAAALEFCQTSEGQNAFTASNHHFDWNCFGQLVPNELCRKHGFEKAGMECYYTGVHMDEALVTEAQFAKEREE